MLAIQRRRLEHCVCKNRHSTSLTGVHETRAVGVFSQNHGSGRERLLACEAIRLLWDYRSVLALGLASRAGIFLVSGFVLVLAWEPRSIELAELPRRFPAGVASTSPQPLPPDFLCSAAFSLFPPTSSASRPVILPGQHADSVVVEQLSILSDSVPRSRPFVSTSVKLHHRTALLPHNRSST